MITSQNDAAPKQRDKEGNWIDEIPDGNDHSIDAVRYAMLDDVLRG